MSSTDAANITLVSPGNGISGGYDGTNVNINRVMMSFTAIAWYNSIELIILVLVSFKHYKGVYFWSLLITSLAIVVYQFGAWGKLVSVLKYPLIPVSLSTWGWVIMMVGQSIVLWSRLHLITQNEKLLKGIFWGILINSFVMCTPTIVLTYGSNTAEPRFYVHGYSIMERIQMTAFSVQELFISGIYLWEVRLLLKVVDQARMRKLMWELVAINIAIIVLDVALLSVEFINLYQIEITLKGMVYSIKVRELKGAYTMSRFMHHHGSAETPRSTVFQIGPPDGCTKQALLKLEFGVLSKLVKIITNRQGLTMEISDEELDAGLAPLKPMYSRDTVTTFGRAPTLVESSTNTYSRRSTNTYSRRSTSLSGANHLLNNPAGGATTLHFLQDDLITLPTALEEVEVQQIPQKPSRRSSANEFYPGRLV